MSKLAQFLDKIRYMEHSITHIYCSGVGFPRDCGKTGHVGCQWNGNVSPNCARVNIAYYILTKEICILPTVNGATWKQVFSRGSFGNVNVGRTKFNQYLTTESCNPIPRGVVARLCRGCVNSHKAIFYKRLTSNVPDMYITFIQDWFSNKNINKRDFFLYGSGYDLLSNRNQWNFCNYDDPGVGFPRDCMYIFNISKIFLFFFFL